MQTHKSIRNHHANRKLIKRYGIRITRQSFNKTFTASSQTRMYQFLKDLRQIEILNSNLREKIRMMEKGKNRNAQWKADSTQR